MIGTYHFTAPKNLTQHKNAIDLKKKKKESHQWLEETMDDWRLIYYHVCPFYVCSCFKCVRSEKGLCVTISVVCLLRVHNLLSFPPAINLNKSLQIPILTLPVCVSACVLQKSQQKGKRLSQHVFLSDPSLHINTLISNLTWHPDSIPSSPLHG